MKSLISVVLTVLSSGCATIVASGPDKIRVDSTPSGATVFVDGVLSGCTPTVVNVDRSSYGLIRLEKEGYFPQQKDIDKVTNGWVFANVLWVFWLPVGVVVDVATGNCGKYPDAPLHFDLVCDPNYTPPPVKEVPAVIEKETIYDAFTKEWFQSLPPDQQVAIMMHLTGSKSSVEVKNQSEKIRVGLGIKDN